jgi:signal transduction histidine kinase/ActR/RegA family two-component response regulator
MADTGPFDGLDGVSPEELRQRLHALQALIARAPVPIAIAHDRECRFISANRALAALLHLPPDANVSLTPPPGQSRPYRIQRNGQDIPERELPMQYAVAHRTSVSNEIELVLADGTVVYVQNDVEPLYDTHGEIYGCVSVCVDLTDRRRAERTLREADRRKDEFLATLSHELRNPLAPIRTAIEVMRIARANPEIVENARATVERQLLHLVRITDDLLDVARITQNKVELRRQRLDLRDVVQSAIEATRPLIDAHAHALTIDLPKQPMPADADYTRLAQVFSNLLNNAAKFTPSSGEIHVAGSVVGGVATVTVSDTGVGVPPSMLPRIFDMFTQLQAHRDRTYGGLGIGLTLAKRLVELHGGTIAALSEGPNRGATFAVRLPCAQAADHEGATPVRDASRQPAGARVLVADDNPDTAEMMRIMLGIKGHEVRTAADGIQAVSIAEAFDPDIAFLDIGMPRMDGYETARRIREVLGPKIRLVALTGWGQDDDKRRSQAAGFDHHLTKPPDPEVLERLIAECSGGSRVEGGG